MRHRGVISAAAASALWVAIWLWFLDHNARTGHQLKLVGFGREWVFLTPVWFAGLSVLPWLWLGAARTLTDFARTQTVISAVVRSFLVTAIVCALARPALTSYGSRVSVVALVDVSGSMSDDQLAAQARTWMALANS